MLKITLIYPRFKQYFSAPPLGIAYIAAVLRENNYNVNIIDTTFGITYEKLRKELLRIEPDIVGISFMTPMVKDAIKVAKTIKDNLNCIVVAGGASSNNSA